MWTDGTAPMGPMDAGDGLSTIACPECGANANPESQRAKCAKLWTGKGKLTPKEIEYGKKLGGKAEKRLSKGKLEKILLWMIVSFCENLAELGYKPFISKTGTPELQGADMWIRYLAADKPKAALKIMAKLIKIMERTCTE